MSQFEYSVVRSKRRVTNTTISVGPKGVIVHAPFWMPAWVIKNFVEECSKNNKIKLITAEKPNIFPEFIVDFFGLGFNSKKYGNEKVKMIYTSLGKYGGNFGSWMFTKWFERVAKKLSKKYDDNF